MALPAPRLIVEADVWRGMLSGADMWVVRTDRGQGTVDHRGEGDKLRPLTPELEQELEARGNGFVIKDERNQPDLSIRTNPPMRSQNLEQSFDQSFEQGDERGW